MFDMAVLAFCVSDEKEKAEGDVLEGREVRRAFLVSSQQVEGGEFSVCRSTLNTCSSLKPYPCNLICGIVSVRVC